MKQRGFTLLEVLIALGILAFIIAATHQILDVATKTNDASQETIKTLSQLQTTFRMMEQDFSQMTKRQVRNESGDSAGHALLYGRYLLDSQYDGIAFVRDGWSNPMSLLPRSELQAVGYRVVDDKLERVYRVYVDQLDNAEPRAQVLLDDIEELKFEFRGSKEDWLDKWDLPSLPRAVAVVITQSDMPPVRKQFLVPGSGRSDDKEEEEQR